MLFTKYGTARVCTAAFLAAITMHVPARAQGTSDRAYRAATGLLNRGMHELAVEEYRAFLRDNPGHAKATEAHYGLAVCLMRLKRPAEAAAELDAVLKVKDFEFAPDAKALRGECCLAAGESAEAVKWFERTIKDHPLFERLDAVTAMYAEALYTLGNRAKARESFELLVERWPKSASRDRADYFLALCDAGDGDYKGAIEHLAALRERSPKGPYAAQATLIQAQSHEHAGDSKAALALYKIAAQAGDAAVEPDATLGTARLTRAAGAPGEARAMLEPLLKKHPTAPFAEAAEVELARTLFDQGKFEDARRLLERAERKPTAERLFWQAKCELKLERPSEAAQLLDRAVKADNESTLLPDILFEQGVALDKAGKEAEAIKCFAAVCRRFENHARAGDALLAAAGMLHRIQKYEDSLGACEEYLQKHGKHARAADARFLIAENEYALGHIDRAEKAYAELLRRDPESQQSARANLRRGLALIELDRGAEATALLEQAAKVAADAGVRRAASAALGDLAFAATDWERAQGHYRDWLDASGKTDGEEIILLKLALSLHRAGKPAEAIPLYVKVSKDYPRSQSARQAAFERGQALAEIGSLDEARQVFEQVIAEERANDERPFTSHALRHLAAIDSKQGRHAEAAARLESLTVSDGSANADALFDRAVMLLNAGDYERASDQFTKFASSFPKHPRAAEAKAQAAIALSRLGPSQDVLAAIESVEADGKTLSAAMRCALLYEKAWTYLQLKQDDESQRSYEVLLGAADIPGTIEAHSALDLAQLRLRAGASQEILQLLDRAVAAAAKLQENDKHRAIARATYLRGASELGLGHPEKAAKILEPLVLQKSESELQVPAALILGEALMKSGKAAEAAAQFRQVADRTKDPTARAGALLRLGEASATAQNWKTSEQAFTEYLEKQPDAGLRYQAQFGLAWARENAGRHEDAINGYRDVIAAHQGPTAARAQFQIGECLFAMKRHDEAVRELLKVDILYDYPEWSAAALFEAGRCMREMGKEAEAQDHFKQVTSRFGDSKWAKLAGEALAAPKKTAPLPGRADRADAGSNPKTK